MEELLNGLKEKVGLDEGMANKVVEYLKEHASQVPQWLASSGIADKIPEGIKDKLPGGLGGLLGG